MGASPKEGLAPPKSVGREKTRGVSNSPIFSIDFIGSTRTDRRT
jgi:hypothetical protein